MLSNSVGNCRTRGIPSFGGIYHNFSAAGASQVLYASTARENPTFFTKRSTFLTEMATKTEPWQEPMKGHDDERSESVRKDGPLSKSRRKKGLMKKSKDSACDAEPPPLPCKTTQTDVCVDHEYRPDMANDPEDLPEGVRISGKFKMKTLEPTSEIHPPAPPQIIDKRSVRLH